LEAYHGTLEAHPRTIDSQLEESMAYFWGMESHCKVKNPEATEAHPETHLGAEEVTA
jgi:hypothetical protein